MASSTAKAVAVAVILFSLFLFTQTKNGQLDLRGVLYDSGSVDLPNWGGDDMPYLSNVSTGIAVGALGDSKNSSFKELRGLAMHRMRNTTKTGNSLFSSLSENSDNSTKHITVSIITPALAGDVLAGKLALFLRSISMQSTLPKEVVVALSDADEAICDRMIREATQMLPKAVTFMANCTYNRMNQATARNIAIRMSTADVCIFNDADDELHYQKVEIVRMLFEQNPNMQAFTHGATRDPSITARRIVPELPSSPNMSVPHHQLVPYPQVNITQALSTQKALFMWGDQLQMAARGPRAKCIRRCWIVNGMVPGASTARRSAALEVPFICRNAAGTLRYDGACFAEDSLWVRNMLKKYREKDSVIFSNLPLIYCVPHGIWKRPTNYQKMNFTNATRPYLVYIRDMYNKL